MADADAALLKRLEKSIEKVESAQAERDRLIVEAVKANVPVPKIGAAVGLSRARVYQIIAEQSS